VSCSDASLRPGSGVPAPESLSIVLSGHLLSAAAVQNHIVLRTVSNAGRMILDGHVMLAGGWS
jgi:hypothetical protein